MGWERESFLTLVVVASIVISLHLAIVYGWHDHVAKVIDAKIHDSGLFCSSVVEPTRHQTDTPRARAYVQYATNLDYFCNALINFDRLTALGTRYEMVLIYPEDWLNSVDSTKQALQFAQKTFPFLTLLPQPLLSVPDSEDTWGHSLTKLNIFALVQYSRILYFDSDTLILKNMDHYFDSPPARIALPRAYWLMDDIGSEVTGPLKLGSHVMLIEPDLQTYGRIINKINETRSFDMEIVNYLFGSSAMVLPHRGLALLSGEFRTSHHLRYLGEGDDGTWDADKEFADSHLVHFSDWPLSKPWLRRSVDAWEEALPGCADRVEQGRNDSERMATVDCPDRRIWVGLYGEYDTRREKVCRFMQA